ncbi:unnamed protein product [Calypogeia fissa]
MSTSSEPSILEIQAKRDQQNLKRRERRENKFVNQLKEEAKQALATAQAEAKKLLAVAREEATTFKKQIHLDFAAEKAAADCRINDLQSNVTYLEARLTQLGADFVSTDSDGNHVVSAADKREANRLAQQKSRENRRRVIACLTEADLDTVSNKGKRSQVHVVAQIVKFFKRLTRNHNFASKRSIMRRFWLHKAMR